MPVAKKGLQRKETS